MKTYNGFGNGKIAALLRSGAVAVLPSDTLYGIMAVAANSSAVQRLFTVRQRDVGKSCIVLLGDIAQLADRSAWSEVHHELVNRYWPGPVSIVLPTTDKTPEYLKRDDGTVAYRLPDSPVLRQLLLKTGPLIAPSANLPGEPPATTVQQAIEYFGDVVDFYVDGGDLSANQASTLVRVNSRAQIEVLRGQLPPR